MATPATLLFAASRIRLRRPRSASKPSCLFTAHAASGERLDHDYSMVVLAGARVAATVSRFTATLLQLPLVDAKCSPPLIRDVLAVSSRPPLPRWHGACTRSISATISTSQTVALPLYAIVDSDERTWRRSGPHAHPSSCAPCPLRLEQTAQASFRVRSHLRRTPTRLSLLHQSSRAAVTVHGDVLYAFRLIVATDVRCLVPRH